MGLLYVDENGAVIGVEANRCIFHVEEIISEDYSQPGM